MEDGAAKIVSHSGIKASVDRNQRVGLGGLMRADTSVLCNVSTFVHAFESDLIE